jgi:hypothetical protein
MPEDPRVVVGSLDSNGRATFNQVTQIQATTQPEEIILVAVDPDAGLYVWRLSHAEVDAHAHEQHPGYSRQLRAIDPRSPPDWLGAPEFRPASDLDAADWTDISAARTNTLKKAVMTALGL